MRRRLAADLATTLGQVLTAWAVVFHVLGPAPTSLFYLMFGATALAVTLRASESLEARAKACFSAALIAAGLLITGLVESGLLLLGGGPLRVALPTDLLLLLVASVLYTMAGAFYWTERSEGP